MGNLTKKMQKRERVILSRSEQGKGTPLRNSLVPRIRHVTMPWERISR